jgi:hypothetical protein
MHAWCRNGLKFYDHIEEGLKTKGLKVLELLGKLTPPLRDVDLALRPAHQRVRAKGQGE